MQHLTLTTKNDFSNSASVNKGISQHIYKIHVQLCDVKPTMDAAVTVHNSLDILG